ncbi:hypothetical protein pb186bvf_016173 [Paramecium bursaria]
MGYNSEQPKHCQDDIQVTQVTQATQVIQVPQVPQPTEVVNQGFVFQHFHCRKYVKKVWNQYKKEGFRGSAEFLTKKINRLLKEDPIIVSDAHNLLKWLQSRYEKEAFIQHNEFIYNSLLYFRDKIIENQEFEKLVEFKILGFKADTIMRYIDQNHIFKYTPEEIMISLACQEVPMSRDFLIDNATNCALWCSAVQKQNFRLDWDEELMMIILDFLDQPWVFRILIGSKCVPYEQVICDKAWEYMKYSKDAMRFIFQEISGDGGDYYGGFLEFQIYEVFDFLILQGKKADDKKFQMNMASLAIEYLNLLWEDEDLFCDTENIFKFQIYEEIAEIPIDLLNKQSLLSIQNFVNRIVQSSEYDLNSIVYNSVWYLRLNITLLYQKIDNKISQNCLLRLQYLCKECPEASIQIQQIISLYQNTLKLVNES